MLSLIPVTIVLFILHRPSAIIETLGLRDSVLRGLLFGFLFTTPLYIGFAIIGHFNVELTLYWILYFCLIPAVFEEILFRGFLFGQLFRVGKLGFFWAALLPAVLFGLFHIYQGNDFLSSVAAFGVTMLGSFFFSWMYVAWNYNLWVPISLHFFMNLAWGLFVVEGTGNAAGGLISNILRAVCIVFAIVFTIFYVKRRNLESLKIPVFKI
jgi:membrane protease YdiL (CAAX protease family)